MTRFTAVLVVALFVGVPVFADQAPAKQKSQPAAATADRSARSALSTLGFDGKPSSLIGCTGGQFYTSHPLGYTAAHTRVKIDVISGEGIDPIASLVVLQMGANAPDGARAQYVYDDDSGGNLDPRIEFTTNYDGNLVLSVGSYSGSFGCYWLKVEVTVP
jgi:hypothetical protein